MIDTTFFEGREVCGTLARAAETIINSSNGSAWNRGVTAYALDLLENLAGLTREQLTNRGTVLTAMLNGARDWAEYSCGGCSLICDTDIAARLCTPSELRRLAGGTRRPNSREDWLAVQARALHQAAGRVAIAVAASANA